MLNAQFSQPLIIHLALKYPIMYKQPPLNGLFKKAMHKFEFIVM